MLIARLCLMAAAGAACAQDFPSKPIRMVTSAAGGGGDVVTRIIAQSISGAIGQQVIVDNRGGVISAETVARAAPDGYTLLSQPNNFWLLPFIQKVSYDPIRDYVPITLSVTAPNVIVVHPSLPVKSVKELIAFAKANPGQLNFAAGSTGSSSHLSGELFKMMAGINIVHISYRGAAQSLNDTLGGQISLLFSNTAAAGPHIKTGRLRGLAITSAQPSVLAPGLPTAASSGLPGYQAAAIYGVFAPAGTPATLVNQLNQEIVKALSRPDVRERFLSASVEVVASTSEHLGATVKADMVRLGKVIRDAGIRE